MPWGFCMPAIYSGRSSTTDYAIVLPGCPRLWHNAGKIRMGAARVRGNSVKHFFVVFFGATSKSLLPTLRGDGGRRPDDAGFLSPLTLSNV